jgi:hypothetical protein
MNTPEILAHGVTRRRFLQSSALAALAVGCPRVLQASTPTFPYRMVFNNDVTNTCNCLSSYMTSPSQPYSASVIQASVQETVGCHCHMFAPAFCWVPLWPSTVLPLQSHVDWIKNTYGTTSQFDRITQWVLQGNDLILEFINACRITGQAAFVSFRLNDSQCCSQVNSGGPLAAWQSIGFNQFYAENPSYRLGTDVTQYAQAAQNWVYDDVRNFKFNLIQELCTNYDLDGIELDFMRQMYYFDQTATTLSQRQSIMNAFIEDVKAVLLATARAGRTRHLSARIPCDLTVCDQVGIDVANLASHGVDMIIVSPSYYTLQASQFAQIKTLAGSMPATLEMANNIQPGYWPNGSSSYRRCTHEQFYTTAYMGYCYGASGMSLFNFAYYRNGVAGTGVDTPYTDPPFDAITTIKGMTSVAAQPQHYFNAGGAGVMTSHEIPVNVYGGAFNFNLDFDLRPPTGGWINGGRFRIKCLDTGAGVTPYTFTGTTWQVYLTNSAYTNILLTPTADTSEPYPTNNPWTQSLGTADQRLAWVVPANLLRTGTNTFTCKKLTGAGYLRVGYADLGVS